MSFLVFRAVDRLVQVTIKAPLPDYRQIGEELLLAEKAIKNYVSRQLAKLSVQQRTQAAILANRLFGR